MKRSETLRRSSPRPNRSEALELIVGRNAALEVLLNQASRVVRIFVLPQTREELRTHHGLVIPRHVEVQELERNKLTDLCGTDSHQGIVLEVKRRESHALDDVIQEAQKDDESESPDRRMIVVLDDVQDPHNLGAILRASECFGVDWVLWSKNRGVQITPTVTKVSVGASEIVRCVPVSNVHDALVKLKKCGYWIIATGMGPEVPALQAFQWPQRSALILGSEGEGVKHLLQKTADFTVGIPQYGRIDSLNVSQAAAVLLFSWRTDIYRNQ